MIFGSGIIHGDPHPGIIIIIIIIIIIMTIITIIGNIFIMPNGEVALLDWL